MIRRPLSRWSCRGFRASSPSSRPSRSKSATDGTSSVAISPRRGAMPSSAVPSSTGCAPSSPHAHNIAPEWDDTLRDLDRLQEIELEQDGKRFLLRTPTTGVAGKLFQAVGVALPPNLQELPLTTPQPAA